MAKSPIKTNRPSDLNKAGFIEWRPTAAGEMPHDTVMAVGKAMNEYCGVGNKQRFERANASRSRFSSQSPYMDMGPGTSVRDEMNRGDYDYFRPSEAIPREKRAIIFQCMEAYRHVGVVRNVIDLMGDFGTQGVQLVHPNRQIQKFFRAWFKRVNGVERSERFLNILYRAGNVFCKRTMAKISQAHEQKLRALAASDIPDDKLSADVEYDPGMEVTPRTIPIRYDILNPLLINPVGGELSQFVGSALYGVTITSGLRKAIVSPKDSAEQTLVDSLPTDIVGLVKAGKKAIPLDPGKLRVFFYKKDDWDSLADPMTYAILDDLKLLEKMKLADLAALDGAISQVRVWKLGSLETNPPIFPTDAAVSKLSDILLSNTGGGAFDLIWGPELSVENYETNVHQFLGAAKYEPVWNSIYAGLGVPPTLTGTGKAGGMTNNYISLKTLVQRLEYGRSLLRQFWEYEIELVRKAMGFRFAAELRFDRMVLSDEAAEKALLIQAIDRNLCSFDTFVERFGESPDLERLRLKRDERERKSGALVDKGGPWNDPEKMYQLTKLALTRTLITPAEAGIDVEEHYKKEPFLMTLDVQKSKVSAAPSGGGGSPPSNSGSGTPGRPKNSGDAVGQPRKRNPKALGEFADDSSKLLTNMMWAKSAQQEISEIITPALLAHYGKKDTRALSDKEFENVEHIKFCVLAKLTPFSEVTQASIKDIVDQPILLDQSYSILQDKFVQKVTSMHGRAPTAEEGRTIKALTCALLSD